MNFGKGPLVIGIGNAYRRDDSAGLWIAQRLKEKKIPGIRIEESSGEITDLMELWKDYETVLAVDALSSGAKPGEIRRFEVHQAPLPAETFHYSTHGLSLAEAVELARAMGKLPGRFIIYAIEGGDFAAGEEISPAVKKGCVKLVERMIQELARYKKEASDA
jgi:hydrogenase maturation protease